MFPPCADYSRQIHEPLIGTIAQATTTFLLEYVAPFGNKALPESAISAQVFQHLARVPHSNCLLIRQPDEPTDTDGKISFFAVNGVTAQQYEWSINAYEDILALDLNALLQGELVPARVTPLYAICTNGKRDQCCSTYGTAFYQALKPLVGADVWQCSHIGGHRFAATGMVFPQGICYGYLDPQDASHLVTLVQKGDIWLEKLRGQIRYSEATQAADYFLRQHLNLRHVEALQHRETTQQDSEWHVTFDALHQTYTVRVMAGQPLDVLSSTNDTQLKRTFPFALIAVEAIP